MTGTHADRPAWPGPVPEPWWYRSCAPSLAAWAAWVTRAQQETPEEAWLRRKNERDRARAPLYVRFGDLPDGGASSTWRRMWRSTGQDRLALTLPADFEAGVSCFRGRRAPGGGYEVLLGSVDQASVFATVVRQERPAYVVEGEEVGVGAGFEPVLNNARIVERADPRGIEAVGFWAACGAVLGGSAPVLSALEGANARVGELARRARARSAGGGSGIHGEDHWKRVAAAGAFLCERTPGADPAVVLLFALFHDAARENDGDDPGHGSRGAALASELRRAGFYALPGRGADLLREACEEHDAGRTSEDPTVGACWDADRLGLWRAGITPDPALLSTAAARDPRMIERCRALQDEPAPSWAALDEWYGMIRAEGG